MYDVTKKQRGIGTFIIKGLEGLEGRAVMLQCRKAMQCRTVTPVVV